MTEETVDINLAREMGLSGEEWEKLLKLLNRNPTKTELGIFSALWSEHCSYKSSKIHLKHLPTKADWVIQGPGENAGIIDIGGGYAIAFKMESHNHPSFIEPYQGAATGVGGIMRDVFTMGARPIANMDCLFFGSSGHKFTPHLLSGVVRGVGDYGNCMGVPTVGGSTFFHPTYNSNILVNAMTVGIVKSDKIFRGLAEGVGNPLIYVGAKTGRDGIHGATMASEEFRDGEESKRPTVQVGDPFTEKLLLEACLELMQGDSIIGIQDMGAAGLTSSAIEMAERAGEGIELDLDKIPLREEGLSAYEVMLSESQERMLIVARKGREDEVLRIFDKWGLDASIIGSVTNTNRVIIRHKDNIEADIAMNDITKNGPLYKRKWVNPENPFQKLNEQSIDEPENYNAALLKLIASPNLCSKKWITRQYDSTVRTNTICGAGADSAVIRIKETEKAVAITCDVNPRICMADSYEGARWAVGEAVMNISCTGGRPMAITDCLNFGNPEKPEVMGSFVKTIEGLSEICGELKIPVVSGNVSFYNETDGRGIYPTPTIGMVGLIENIGNIVPNYFNEAGLHIYLIGNFDPHLDLSEYLSFYHNREEGSVNPISISSLNAVKGVLHVSSKNKLIESAHDLSDGGLLISAVECSLYSYNSIGFSLNLPPTDMRWDKLLFGEGNVAAIISTKKENLPAIEELCKNHNCPCTEIGKTGGHFLEIWIGKECPIHIPILAIKEAWDKPLAAIVEGLYQEKGNLLCR